MLFLTRSAQRRNAGRNLRGVRLFGTLTDLSFFLSYTCKLYTSHLYRYYKILFFAFFATWLCNLQQFPSSSHLDIKQAYLPELIKREKKGKIDILVLHKSFKNGIDASLCANADH